jgi:predicted nucleic acid-binding Zn ribbon protein
MESKVCIQCNNAIIGRSDKKFCDDYCRNAYNNIHKRDSNNIIRNINNCIRKNRNLLESQLQEKDETARVSRERLIILGFIFKYHTHTYTNKKGDIYYYCYDLGYLPLEADWFLIVRNNH